MKTVTQRVNSYNYRKDLADALCDKERLNRCSVYVFIDTNILLWCYRANEHARNELLALLETIKKSNRLFFPAWVIQEYNNHLFKMSEDVFTPIKRISKDLNTKLCEFARHLLLTGDSEFAGKIKEISSEIKTRTDGLTKKSGNIRECIECLIQGSVLDSNLTSLIEYACIYGEYRFKNKIPPGYMDKNKEDNNYGDYIIWREIIDKCASENRSSAIIITNDVKEDWVYAPSYILSAQKDKSKNNDFSYIQIPNNGQHESKLYLPHPFLEYEFKKTVGEEYDICIINIDTIAFILSSKDYNPETNQNFSYLAQSVSVEIKNTVTAIVIEWFLKNESYYKEAMRIYDPTHDPRFHNHDYFTDIENLKDYVRHSLPNVVIEDVDWNRIAVELFI